MTQYAPKQYEKQQTDATISQANPVSATLYTVLATTKNVKIISIEAHITWAVTQPTPLEVVVTIDGQSQVYKFDNPVSGSIYLASREDYQAPADQVLLIRDAAQRPTRPTYLVKGISVKVEARITWAITQPTPLVCRVKYTKLA